MQPGKAFTLEPDPLPTQPEIPPAPPPNLRKKLLNVMKSVGYIQKRGFNAFHKYHYALEADVAEKVREAFIEQGLLLLPDVKSVAIRGDDKNKITSVNMTFTVLDVDSDEELAFDMPGDGQDVGDKGVYKAITGAEKYALMKLLMISTGDDPEDDTGNGTRRKRVARPTPDKTRPTPADDTPKITREQLADIDTLLRDINRTESWVMKKLGYGKRLEDIKAVDYTRVVEGIENARAAGLK